jgi:hypothetical protein
VPALGTSWYERGFSYWARRAGAVLLLCVAVAIYAAIIAGVMSAAGPPGSAGFIGVLIGEVVFSAVTGVFAFRHLWRLGITGRSAQGSPRGAAGAGAGLLAFQAGVVGAAILAASVLLSAGFVLAALVMWLAPVLPAERYARDLVARELEQYRSDHAHPYRKRGRRTR